MYELYGGPEVQTAVFTLNIPGLRQARNLYSSLYFWATVVLHISAVFLKRMCYLHIRALRFYFSVPLDLDVKAKATLVSAVFLIVSRPSRRKYKFGGI